MGALIHSVLCVVCILCKWCCAVDSFPASPYHSNFKVCPYCCRHIWSDVSNCCDGHRPHFLCPASRLPTTANSTPVHKPLHVTPSVLCGNFSGTHVQEWGCRVLGCVHSYLDPVLQCSLPDVSPVHPLTGSLGEFLLPLQPCQCLCLTLFLSSHFSLAGGGG